MNLPKTNPRKLVKTFSISDEDPFARIFDLKKIEAELQQPRNKSCHHDHPKKDVTFEKGTSSKGDMKYFPPFDGTQDSRKYEDFDEDGSDESDDEENCPCPGHWKTKAYYKLPENVRNAIDIAKTKSKHSEFWYKLQTLNDKIYIYRSVYYSKMPAY